MFNCTVIEGSSIVRVSFVVHIVTVVAVKRWLLFVFVSDACDFEFEEGSSVEHNQLVWWVSSPSCDELDWNELAASSCSSRESNFGGQKRHFLT